MGSLLKEEQLASKNHPSSPRHPASPRKRQQVSIESDDRKKIPKWTWDKTKPLDEQVKILEDRVLELQEDWRFSETSRSFDLADVHWSAVDPRNYPNRFQGLFRGTWNWALNWAGDNGAHLSKEQKANIIARLNGYIIQEDFDAIQARLNPDWQKVFLQLLTEMFLNKTVVKIMFENPFEIGGDGDDVTTTPGSQFLNALYSRFQGVNGEHAHIWRLLTLRLSNRVHGSAEDKSITAFGEATRTHREARCEVLAKHLLSDKTFLSLLKNIKGNDDDVERLRSLTISLKLIAQTAVDMSVRIPVLKFQTLKDVDPYASANSNNIKYEGDTHAYRDDEFMLEGHRVVGITRPYVTRTLNAYNEKEVELVYKAVALVEWKKSEDERHKEKK
ncbi:hypothetical protein BJY04DRAFT_220588 [Aspergillus karnatakaensis]|uniref:uncharacterized protein n=1 Tax=Aspergillus karnatakaensis TaxID=1810916 RepID=UPI003CCCABCC